MPVHSPVSDLTPLGPIINTCSIDLPSIPPHHELTVCLGVFCPIWDGGGGHTVLGKWETSVTVSIFPRLWASQACGCVFYECLYKQMAGEHSAVTGRGDKAWRVINTWVPASSQLNPGLVFAQVWPLPPPSADCITCCPGGQGVNLGMENKPAHTPWQDPHHPHTQGTPFWNNPTFKKKKKKSITTVHFLPSLHFLKHFRPLFKKKKIYFEIISNL